MTVHPAREDDPGTEQNSPALASESGVWRLYADAGNTAIKWAVREADAWVAEGRLPIEALGDTDEAVEAALRGTALDPAKCAGAALVSSRPSDIETVARALEQATGVEVAILGRDIHSGLRSSYADPAEIGQDRLALAEGALALMGAPVIVIALGTCITAQWLDDDEVMAGGAIAAGLEAQVDGIGVAVPHLREAAAVAADSLRHGALDAAREQSTVTNLAEGLKACLAGTVRSLCDKARREIGEAPVVATGGDAVLAGRLSRCFDRIEPLLVLEGLRVVDERSRRR